MPTSTASALSENDEENNCEFFNREACVRQKLIAFCWLFAITNDVNDGRQRTNMIGDVLAILLHCFSFAFFALARSFSFLPRDVEHTATTSWVIFYNFRICRLRVRFFIPSNGNKQQKKRVFPLICTRGNSARQSKKRRTRKTSLVYVRFVRHSNCTHTNEKQENS